MLDIVLLVPLGPWRWPPHLRSIYTNLAGTGAPLASHIQPCAQACRGSLENVLGVDISSNEPSYRKVGGTRRLAIADRRGRRTCRGGHQAATGSLRSAHSRYR